MIGHIKGEDRIKCRLVKLLDLEDKIIATIEHVLKDQVIIKCWFDKRTTIKYFRIFLSCSNVREGKKRNWGSIQNLKDCGLVVSN